MARNCCLVFLRIILFRSPCLIRKLIALGLVFNHRIEMEFHIGSYIKKIADSRKKGPTELGREISTSKQNIYGIFKRKSIDTLLLMKLSRALNHDFFMEYVQMLGIHPNNQGGGSDHKDLQIENLKKDLEECRNENNRLLKELVEALKKLNDKD